MNNLFISWHSLLHLKTMALTSAASFILLLLSFIAFCSPPASRSTSSRLVAKILYTYMAHVSLFSIIRFISLHDSGCSEECEQTLPCQADRYSERYVPWTDHLHKRRRLSYHQCHQPCPIQHVDTLVHNNHVDQLVMIGMVPVDSKTATAILQYKGVPTTILPVLPQLPASNDNGICSITRD